MSRWDFVRNEPINAQNTQDTLSKLSAAAQRHENAGDTGMANRIHQEINKELDELDGLRG
ncbi:hypothetical protein OG601_47260 [Streptomyces sp. NBC_01239]|uniref:hypothetical protein n=1 Tax=Streptomyces sp. NBC_01239 TaxID=2903792 RepID=UPI0022538B9D|nr:hypothetical protein [Streptomyces sp. NBC_01239]MCX4809008.1 hypothetical protein [Streptomyces sp. NBC_01239]MCX4816726.1 hypothetical protein [Streptomyces sp. NBC_01239]MCX4818174.1 hypothetical protein [Streptomyces sp. NBC_01239]